jgi:hypothetical protein
MNQSGKIILSLTLLLLFSSAVILTAVNPKKVTSIVSKAKTTVKSTTSTSTSSTSSSSSNTAEGLKEALTTGVTNAVLKLNKENGYFGDAALKIALPKEADPIVKNIKLVPGGQKLLDNVVLRLNRAAEDAAGEAKPIFVSAIKNMTITDATSILFGSDKTGATNYLKKNTNTQLTATFKPKIETSLDKKLVGNLSTTESWNTLTTSYNKVAQSFVGKSSGLTPVNSDLGAYVTEQALNGMFITVGNEEKKIRENPAARVTSLLQSVFGALDKK